MLSLALLLAASACRTARIEPFGETKLSALCVDVKRCGARGDSVLNLLKKQGARLYLSKDKGPEQLLGKVAPGRDVASVMKTCGAEVTVTDWLSAPDVIRQFKLGKEGKRELRERLHAYLSARVAALAIPSEHSAEQSLRKVIDAIDAEQVSWVGVTYWLTDSAFERRVGQCGEEERENIIYSLTVFSPSEAFQSDFANKLEQALLSVLGEGTPADKKTDRADTAERPQDETDTSVPPSADSDSRAVAARYDTLSRDVVRALARDTRVVAALGFDDL